MRNIPCVQASSIGHEPTDIFGSQAKSCSTNLLHTVLLLQRPDCSFAYWLDFARWMFLGPARDIEITAVLEGQWNVIAFPNIWDDCGESVGGELISQPENRLLASFTASFNAAYTIWY